MKKNLSVITLAALTTLMMSCDRGDCTNWIKDGDESGVDCGGSCVPCQLIEPSQNPRKDSLIGKWELKRYDFTHTSFSEPYQEIHIPIPNSYLELLEDDRLRTTISYTQNGLMGIPPFYNVINNTSRWDVYTTFFAFNTPSYISSMPMTISHLGADSLVLKYCPDLPPFCDTIMYYYFKKI